VVVGATAKEAVSSVCICTPNVPARTSATGLASLFSRGLGIWNLDFGGI